MNPLAPNTQNVTDYHALQEHTDRNTTGMTAAGQQVSLVLNDVTSSTGLPTVVVGGALKTLPIADTLGNLAVPGTLTVGGLPVTATPLKSASVASSAAINTTETVLQTLTIVPASTLKVQSRIRINASGVCTSTNADVSTFTVRAGTAGTTSDASVVTTTTTAAAGAAIPFKIIIDLTVQTLGASGTTFGSSLVTNNGVTGLSNAAIKVANLTSSTLATTTATKLSLTYVSAATTTTCTFNDVTVEVLS